jgi:hypothetical protein
MTKSDMPDVKPEILMLAYLCIKGDEELEKRVEILDRFGLNNQISQVCGSAIQSVRNARVRYKKNEIVK